MGIRFRKENSKIEWKKRELFISFPSKSTIKSTIKSVESTCEFYRFNGGFKKEMNTRYVGE